MIALLDRPKVASETTASLRTEIRRKTQQSRDNRLLYRMVCMLLLAEGHSPQSLAEWFGEHPRTLDRWRKRFEDKGIAGLRDETSPGRPPRLSNEQTKELEAEIQLPPYTFGYSANRWRGKVLQTHIERRYGAEISLRHCQRLLKQMRSPGGDVDEASASSDPAEQPNDATAES